MGNDSLRVVCVFVELGHFQDVFFWFHRVTRRPKLCARPATPSLAGFHAAPISSRQNLRFNKKNRIVHLVGCTTKLRWGEKNERGMTSSNPPFFARFADRRGHRRDAWPNEMAVFPPKPEVSRFSLQNGTFHRMRSASVAVSAWQIKK